VNTSQSFFSDEQALEEALSRPTGELVEMFSKLESDILFLGVSGKMGISMACMAKRAFEIAGVTNRVIGVSRFSNQGNIRYLEDRGVETIAGDLLDTAFLQSLPKIANVVYLAGTKFGTSGNEAFTWAMNAFLPGLVAEYFKDSRIVALSTGCVYPLVPVEGGGSVETDQPDPIGEYAQSCLGRERMFEYGSSKYGTPVTLVRLNYAVEMRYGVLVDIAAKVLAGEIINVSMGYANVLWQGEANAYILRCLELCGSPAEIINVTGPERLSIRDVACQFGELFGKEPVIEGEEQHSALLSNASRLFTRFGSPNISARQVIEWTASWVSAGKPLLGKPTHFEVRDGTY
jgi:nucleoside-diphosphate-sugar epimerase